MEVVLYLATSVDGYIATVDGDSDWVQDDELFERLLHHYGCVVLGRNTFEQYKDDPYPVEGVEHIVLSTQTKAAPKYPNVHIASSVGDAISQATTLGFDKLLVIGGAKTAQSFIEAKVVNKLFIDVHSVVLGTGMRMLDDYTKPVTLKLENGEPYEDFVHLEYTVNQ